MPELFDLSNAPFNRLDDSEQKKLTSALDIAYYNEGEVLLREGEAPAHLFILIKGLVHETRDGETVSYYTTHDNFDAMALFDDRSASTFVVEEELITYLLPAKLFLELARNNISFASFYSEKLSDKLAAQAEADRSMHDMLATPAADAFLNPAVTIAADSPLTEAARVMKENVLNTLLVERGHELGLVTTSQLRDAVLIDQRSIDSPCGDLAVYNPISIASDQPLSNAMMLMSKHRIHRVLVKDDEQVIGILEMMNLLSFLNNHTHLVTLEVERAQSPDDLHRAVEGFLPLIQVMQKSGTRISVITQLASEINHRLFTKLFEFLAPPDLVENSCLVVMGSEGRKEQILHTDQDNALIVRDGFDLECARLVGEAFTEALIDFGYPPCPGGMMLNNPKWCRHQSDYRHDFVRWISQPTEQSMLDLSAFVDSARVCGDKQLLVETKDYLFEYSASFDKFHAQFARPIDSFDVPLGLFHRLIVEHGEHEGEIDIKKGGIFPVVHGVRALCLEKGIFKTNTIKRLHALADAGILEREFTLDLVDAFEFMLGLKLRAGLNTVDGSSSNFVAASDLHKLEKDLLKDSLALVKEFKGIVHHHFRLDRF
jgi:CBS domain-containing protein